MFVTATRSPAGQRAIDARRAVLDFTAKNDLHGDPLHTKQEKGLSENIWMLADIVWNKQPNPGCTNTGDKCCLSSNGAVSE